MLVTFGVIGFGVYVVRKKFELNPDDSKFCDYCGNKLLENPMGSTFLDNKLACPIHGYDCKKPD